MSSTLWQWEANYAYRLQKSEHRPSKITLVICRDAKMNQAQINFLVASAFTDSRHARASYAAWRSTEVNSAYQNRPWMVRCSLKWKAYTDIFFSVSHARTCFRFFSVIVFDFISKRGKNCAKTTGPKNKTTKNVVLHEYRGLQHLISFHSSISVIHAIPNSTSLIAVLRYFSKHTRYTNWKNRKI